MSGGRGQASHAGRENSCRYGSSHHGARHSPAGDIVPQHMGRNLLPCEFRHAGGGTLHEFDDAMPGVGFAMPAPEDAPAAGRAVPGERGEGLGGARPHRSDADLSSLAMDRYTRVFARAFREMQIFHLQSRRLGGSRPGVVEEQQEGVLDPPGYATVRLCGLAIMASMFSADSQTIRGRTVFLSGMARMLPAHSTSAASRTAT